jgi:tetratricopeptide (TPR) repeat protein
VLAAQPNYAEAWFNRANVLARLGRHTEAIVSFDRARALAPGNADVLINRGNALAALAQHEAAIASFDEALLRAPGYVEALSNRAVSLKALRRFDEARESCELALARKPDHVLSLMTLGNVLHAMERYDEALPIYERALARNPADVVLLNNRGLALVETARYGDALANAERVLALDAGNADAYFTRANALRGLSRYDEAIVSYEQAIALRPDFAMAKWNLSTCYLSLGRLAEGWKYYECRWFAQVTARPRQYPQPAWQGGRLPGTLLVWGDEGLGDQIIYASMFAELKHCADEVVAEVDARLLELYARSFPGLTFAPLRPELYGGRVDAQLPISSLPRLLRPDWQSFPQRTTGFLVPEPGRVRALRQRLAADGRPVIGLTWVSRNRKLGRYKSAQLRDFEALLRVPGYRFIDLQYGDTAAERETVARELGVTVEHLDDIDNTNDIDALAALAAACDVVLTVSSTTAHLAGSVGAPTFVMVPASFGNIWYWFRDRSASPWYPAVQVRRQAQQQSWSDVVAALAAEVAAAAKAQSERASAAIPRHA